MADIKQIQLSGSELPFDIKDQHCRDWISSFLDTFYPVGCYFETSDGAFDPNTWGGTWILETPGQVHVSGGTGYTVAKANNNSGAGASDGGAATVTLTTTQMPAHTHTGPSHTHTGPSHTHTGPSHTHSASSDSVSLTANSAGAHTHTVVYGHFTESGSNNQHNSVFGSGYSGSTSSAGAHTHSINAHAHTITIGAAGTGATGAAGTGATGSAGGGGSHNTMQPYINVYRWHRTA